MRLAGGALGAAQPFDSVNWCAALAVVLERCNGDPRRLARLGPQGFEAAVRRELPRWGGQRVWRRIITRGVTALTDAAGVSAQRRGALERARWVLDDWRTCQGPPGRGAKPAWSRCSTSWA